MRNRNAKTADEFTKILTSAPFHIGILTVKPPEGLLTMGVSFLTSSVAKVDVILGIAGIERLKILSSISFVACSSGYTSVGVIHAWCTYIPDRSS